MNTDLLNKVKETILAAPAKFEMELFYTECGTAACIGGWAIHLGKDRSFISLASEYYSIGGNIPYQAQEVLGLDGDQAGRLFLLHMWPEKAQRKFRQASQEFRAQIAADRIEHFILTEGKE